MPHQRRQNRGRTDRRASSRIRTISNSSGELSPLRSTHRSNYSAPRRVSDGPPPSNPVYRSPSRSFPTYQATQPHRSNVFEDRATALAADAPAQTPARREEYRYINGRLVRVVTVEPDWASRSRSDRLGPSHTTSRREPRPRFEEEDDVSGELQPGQQRGWGSLNRFGNERVGGFDGRLGMRTRRHDGGWEDFEARIFEEFDDDADRPYHYRRSERRGATHGTDWEEEYSDTEERQVYRSGGTREFDDFDWERDWDRRRSG